MLDKEKISEEKLRGNSKLVTERKGKKHDIIARKVNEFLEIPGEIATNVPKITITGFGELVIENYKGILEYEDFFVRINTEVGIVNINGLKLNLKQMTDENILITGKIESIDYEQNINEEDE